MTEKEENLKQLQAIRECKENWNGYGAKGFQPELCDFVEQIINTLDEEFQFEVFPTGRESIQFEDEENGEYLEFEIFKDNRIKAFYMDKNDKTVFDKVVSLEEMLDMIKEFKEGR